MKKIFLIFLFFSFVTQLHAIDKYKFRYACITEDLQVYRWEESETPLQTCPNNNGHSIATQATVIVETDLDTKKTDSWGRQEVYILSANPDFQAQWTSISDHIDIATPTNNIRGGGQKMYWNTSTDDQLMYPASATLSTNPNPCSACLGAYHQNALEHHVFPGQRPIPSGWKRKRLRFLFRDVVNIREGYIKYRNAVHGKVIIDSFVFLRNMGMNPYQEACTPFDTESPVNDTTNPAGWILTAYVSAINVEGNDFESFLSEKSSSDLTFFSYPYPILELWIEVTYDPNDSQLQSTPCTGSGRAFIFRKNTVDNGYEM